MDAAKRITLADEPPLRIGALVVEPAARTVHAQDGTFERLEPRVMQVLVQLARAGETMGGGTMGGVVSRDSLIECCWAGQVVGDDAINRVISRLRRLCEERSGEFRIETIPRIGYRLLAVVTAIAIPDPPAEPGLPAPVPALTLIRRSDARRRRFWVRWAVAGSLVSVVMAGLAGEALRARADARARRADAEQLVEFMLGDLRKRLDAVGRLDVLDAVAGQTMAYYAKQDLVSLSADELARRAKALRMVGELREQRGDFPMAVNAFEQAAATTGELMARDPGNGQRVFDHAQSVYWVGNVARRQGDIKNVYRANDEYARLADRLVRINPSSSIWRAEVGYSRQNRGAIAYNYRRFGEAIPDLRSAAAIFSSLVKRHPSNTEFQTSFAEASAWLSDDLRARGDLVGAERARSDESATYRAAIARDPTNNALLRPAAWCEHRQGNIAFDRGDIPGALAHFAKAQRMSERLLELEPNDVETIERAIPIELDLADALAATGKGDEAMHSAAEARRIAATLIAKGSGTDLWRDLQARCDIVLAELTLQQHDPKAAQTLVEGAIGTIAAMPKSNLVSDDVSWRARGLAVLARVQPDGGRSAWQSLINLIEPLRPNLRMEEQCLLAIAYTRTQRANDAAPLLDQLRNFGYARQSCL